MKQFCGRRYCVLFAYDTDTDYAGKYAILTANCLETAYRKAVQRYGVYLVRLVLTEYMFFQRNYVKLYGFTLKEDLTRN